MKKWMYLIFPTAMLGVFLVFYLASKKKWDEAESARIAQVQQAKEADEAKKTVAESAARVAATKRAADQKKEDEAREKAKQEKWDADSRAIQVVTDKANSEVAASNQTLAALQHQADTLRKKKEALNREDFDLLKQVELAQIHQRDSELEIQRTVQMIADRAHQSALAQIPPPPPAPARK
jgi:hypothetical protein